MSDKVRANQFVQLKQGVYVSEVYEGAGVARITSPDGDCVVPIGLLVRVEPERATYQDDSRRHGLNKCG
jgi:hypothetical protein